jgi:radical SAM protein with 4Fe4S-binding SPASM domain
MKVTIFNQRVPLKYIWQCKKQALKGILHGKRLRNLAAAYASKIFRLSEVKGFPFSIMVEPSAFCNLRCPMCPKVQENVKRKEGNMSFENYKRLIDEISDYVIFLFLWNYGEPLMNKDLTKMIKYAKSKDMIVVTSSNVQLLTTKTAKDIISSGLDYLTISFDGASEDTYTKYRYAKAGNKGTFERAISNIKMLVHEKNRQGRKTPLLNLQFLVMRDNENEVNKIKELGELMGVDRVLLKKPVIANEKNLFKLLPKDKNFVINPYEENYAKNKFCVRPWFHSVVNWDGSVVPCCYDHKFRFVFGNAFKDGFGKVWNSKKYVDFRRRVIEDTNSIDICRHCSGKNFNRLFE